MNNCSRCGECCKYIVFTTSNQFFTIDEIEYYLYRNIKVEKINRNSYRFIIPAVCKHLTKDNLCAIWDKRPKTCKYSESRLKIWKPPSCTD